MNLSTVFNSKQLWFSIALLFLLKTATVTSLRVIYPFASFFADEMGVSIGQFFGALSIGEIISAGCPFLGPLAERVGPRRMLVWAGGFSAVALVGMGLAVKSFAGFIVAWTAYNCAVAFVFGAGGAFVGLFVPTRSRTRATAAAECSWGAASFAGQIFVGWVISNTSYGWAYYSMGLFTAAVVCAMYIMFKFVDARQDVTVFPIVDTTVTAATIAVRPASSNKAVLAVRKFHIDALDQNVRDEANPGQLCDSDGLVATSAGPPVPALTSSGSKRSVLKFGASARYLKQSRPATQLSLLQQFGVVFKDGSAVALLCGVLASIAVAAVAFSNYAPWVIEQHNLSAEQLGSVSTSIGVAETIALISVLLLGHRLMLIAVKRESLLSNMAVVAVLFAFNEAQFVFQLSSATLVAKSAQTTMYLTIFASVQVARFVAALTVHPMWASGGIILTAVCLAGIQLFGLIAMAVVWHRTSLAAASQPVAPTVAVIQEEDEAAIAEEIAA